MRAIRCRVPESLWRALEARQRATGESVEHTVRAALADHLQVDHSTLFQISSSAALFEGIYRGELVEAAANQPEFELPAQRAAMIGFWSPAYATTLSVPGYHLHVLTADRTAGGHVLECGGRGLRVQIQRELDLRVSLPHSAEFLRA